jgi:myo-inositol-1(or 4)-monophosphatase
MKELESLCKSAIDIIKEAGSYIRNERLRFDQKNIEFKSSRDMVSYVDKNAEKMLVEKLSALLPQAGFITEEKTTDKVGAINWIIDPLDGTTNFISGFPLYSSTLALEKNNEILLGVTYDICADKCYYAWKNGGAYCNGNKISVKKNNQLEKALVIVGTPYSMDNIGTAYFNFIRHLYDHSLGIRVTGTAAIDMAYVAAGYNDAFILFNQKSWDIAAGYIIMKEAGGYASTFSGKEDIHCPEIVASGNLQEELLALIKKFELIR